MQKAELKLDVHCERMKQKAMEKVCSISGVNSLEMKDGKLTVTGEIDAYIIVKKLKKICHTKIISFGPVKEPEKKTEPKKPEVGHYFPNHCPPYYYTNGCEYENQNNCVMV